MTWVDWAVGGTFESGCLFFMGDCSCLCVVILSVGCLGLMGNKSFSSASFWVEIVQFFIAGFVVSLMLAWLGVVGWLNDLLFGVFTASLVFIDQRLVARFRTP